MTIFTESQDDRDLELSQLVDVDIETIKQIKIAELKAIGIFNETQEPSSESEYINLRNDTLKYI